MTIAEAPLALTMGDPAGLGPELTLAAWRHFQHSKDRVFFSLASAELLHRIAPDCPIETIHHPSDAKDVFSEALPVLNIDLDIDQVIPGQPNEASAAAVIHSIDMATTFAQSKTASGVVTNPIHKASLQDHGFAFPGHTEYFAHLCSTDGNPAESVMMLAIPGLRVVPLTIHLPLNTVSSALSAELISRRAKIVAASLVRDFHLRSPTLGVAALNPHGGEAGKFGHEEATIIAPAIAQLQSEGLDIKGPYPADTLFAEHIRSKFDAILCMYHDQALIPLKALDFHRGVNITLGLSIVRTSPDHGTGFDIAGKNMANPDSLIAAITLAQQLAENRASQDI